MIKAKIIADSISKHNGQRITTFEVEFPRWILSEANTHRQLSRNSASSRAIPIKSNIENILANTAIPVQWGINQAGMVADNEADEETSKKALEIWLNARDNAIKSAESLVNLGIHKQVANRLIENFTYQKVVATATNWDNFFWLRSDKNAQPEIRVLSDLMLSEYNKSTPRILDIDEWHTPYYKDGYWNILMDDSLEDALMISSSCCAQVSYRKNDPSIEKARNIFDMLNLTSDDTSNKKHSSPVEHQATPIPSFYRLSDRGITHQNKDGVLCSGNFTNWIQYRHLFANESCKNHPDVTKKNVDDLQLNQAMKLLSEVELYVDEWNFPITLKDRLIAMCNSYYGDVRPFYLDEE